MENNHTAVKVQFFSVIPAEAGIQALPQQNGPVKRVGLSSGLPGETDRGVFDPSGPGNDGKDNR